MNTFSNRRNKMMDRPYLANPRQLTSTINRISLDIRYSGGGGDKSDIRKAVSIFVSLANKKLFQLQRQANKGRET
jgi:hypothetical protein